jgi:hypothetical protein
LINRLGFRGSGTRRGWSLRAVGVLMVLGMAGFVVAQALGMPTRNGGAGTSTPSTTLPAPDPPPAKPKPTPKAKARPKPKPQQKVRASRQPRKPTTSPPPPLPARVQSTATYTASPPPPPTVAVAPSPPAPIHPAAPPRPASRKQNLTHRAAHVSKVAKQKVHRPIAHNRIRPLAGGVLAGRALASGPKVGAVAPTVPGKRSSWSILLAFLILPVLLGLAATLPGGVLPQRVGGLFEHHRTNLAIAGIIGSAVVLVAWLVTFGLGSGGR